MNQYGIVGIQYVGKKDRQEDTVCKTGAVWTHAGQVLNFAAALAKRLLVHTDSFAEAPLDPQADTFMSAGRKTNGRAVEVPPVINLWAMGPEQLAHFARIELDRVVLIDGRNVDEIREEVHRLMINRNLDAEGERRQQEAATDGKVAITYMATQEEFEAYQDGIVRLAIIPAEVTIDAGGSSDASGNGDGTNSDQASTGTGGTGDDNDGQGPTLDELLPTLNRDQLMEFARQESIDFRPNIGEDKLRTRIFDELIRRQEEAAGKTEQQGA